MYAKCVHACYCAVVTIGADLSDLFMVMCVCDIHMLGLRVCEMLRLGVL